MSNLIESENKIKKRGVNMNITCHLLSSEGSFIKATIPSKMLVELCESLKRKSSETVHLSSRSVEVEGIFLPAKDSKKTLMALDTSDL